MANDEHVAMLRKGVDAWNEWRRQKRFSIRPDLAGADLDGVNLDVANLRGVNLSGTILAGADMRDTILAGANLDRANLFEANLTGAVLHRTVFGATTLSEVKGLDQCYHWGPSIVDFQTLKNSSGQLYLRPVPTPLTGVLGTCDIAIS